MAKMEPCLKCKKPTKSKNVGYCGKCWTEASDNQRAAWTAEGLELERQLKAFLIRRSQEPENQLPGKMLLMNNVPQVVNQS